jgi:hypothetical protein
MAAKVSAITNAKKIRIFKGEMKAPKGPSNNRKTEW